MAYQRKNIGMHAHQSRFALLSVDSDSEDGEEQLQPQESFAKSGSGAAKKRSNSSSNEQQQGGNKSALKNAKKRSRKKNRTQSNSSDGNTVDSPKDEVYLQTLQQKNQAAIESEYQKELEEALMLSLAEAEEEKQKQLEAMRNYARLQAQARSEAASERTATQTSTEQSAAAAPQGKTKSKKGVTLSLQEFNRTGVEVVPLVKSPTEERHEPQPSPPVVPEIWSDAWGDDSSFFDKVHSDALQQVIKDQYQATSEPCVAEIVSERSSESARVAQLQDDLEKRNTVIKKIAQENRKLQEELNEVKKRNQRLCRILSKGEIASKTELVQQIEDMTAMKDELSSEIESLNALLEQERSKNKTLKSEVKKLQGSKQGTKS